ncbi:hypothetical protein Pmani_002773 [Petrolisthes manimaculis]|uniref:RNA-directed DNA polymerase n=2 Tax=Petrolisthes manimaculis TaxID=1843537 RepID=A0AAE1QHX5_9EUCA|nr:hypothetical protein Pmani_002773 [Petrolisthes manimaculis]
MLQQGIIENSVSNFNSPMFLVPKSSGEWRPVVDFRALNKITVPPRNSVFIRLQDAGLKLKLSKCAFVCKQTTFLGHTIDADGIHTLQNKVHAVSNYPTPTNTDQVRSFLGLSGYYRRFIKDYALIASSLTSLLKKDVPFQWSETRQKSFCDLKHALTSAPVLAYPDFSKPFILNTDASYSGLGAVLMQKHQGKNSPIAYASRTLNKAEKNYAVTEIESLAVVWALKKFKYIIYCYPVEILTDHKPLLHLFKGKDLSGRMARWLLTVQDYMPTFTYIKGKANVAADALSRNCALTCAVSTETPTFDTLTHTDIFKAQRDDPMWSKVISYLETGNDLDLSHVPSLSHYVLQDDILYKATTLTGKYEPSRLIHQLVIPHTLVPSVLKLIHDTSHASYPGKEKALSQARLKYFWLTMRRDINNHIDLCHTCARTKGNIHPHVPILSYPIPSSPWDVIAIDLLKLPITERGNQYMLVCVDHFSRFSVLVPIPNKAAQTVARAILNYVICPFTTPKVILSDNGTEFVNQVLISLCKEFNIKKANVLPYRSSANGLVERHNRKILNTLRSLVPDTNTLWDTYTPQVMASLNSTINKSISETPHYILFAQDKRLPYELLAKKPNPVYNMDDFVKSNVHTFQQIHQRIQHSLALSKADMLLYHNKSTSNFSLEIGDIVYSLVEVKHSKLDPKFDGPFRVIAKEHGNKVKLLKLKNHTETTAHLDSIKKVHSGLDCEDPQFIPTVSQPPHSPPPPASPENPPLFSQPPQHSYNLRSHT